MGRWVVAIITDYGTPDELWRRKDQPLCSKSMRIPSVSSNCNDVGVIIGQDDLNSGPIQIDVFFSLLDQMVHQSSVSFRPRNQRLRLNTWIGDARAKVKEARPCARLV